MFGLIDGDVVAISEGEAPPGFVGADATAGGGAGGGGGGGSTVRIHHFFHMSNPPCIVHAISVIKYGFNISLFALVLA